MYNPEATQQLVFVVAPIMLCWFGTGFVIAVLYHLSLYYIEGEFTEKDDLLLDIFVSLIRFPLYLFAWPAVLFFDRTALHRIKLLWSYLEPKSREKDEELQDYLKERRYRRWASWRYQEKEGLTARRDREAVANVEKTSRRRRLSPDSPELEKIWLFLGVGRSSAGVEQIVRRYPDAVLPDEINRAAKEEVSARRAWDCLRCREPLTPNRVELPEPFYLEIIDEGQPILEGWAYEGEFRQVFPECPKCGAKQPY